MRERRVDGGEGARHRAYAAGGDDHGDGQRLSERGTISNNVNITSIYNKNERKLSDVDNNNNNHRHDLTRAVPKAIGSIC